MRQLQWMLLRLALLSTISSPEVDGFSTSGIHQFATKGSYNVPSSSMPRSTWRGFSSRYQNPDPTDGRRHWLSRSGPRRHSGYSSPNLEEMGDVFQSLWEIFRATIQYTTKRFVSWCDRPLTQVQQWTLLLVYYFFHMTVLSQHNILFPWQLIPNNKGHFCSVGWDSAAGMISLAIFAYVKRGSVYFRKPWRRLLEVDDSLETTAAAAIQPNNQIKQLEVDDVVSQVLQQAPRQFGLKRSSKPEPLQSSEEISSMVRTNETATLTSANVNYTLLPAPASDSSTTTPEKSPNFAVPESQPPSSPRSTVQTYAISQSQIEEGKTPDSATPNDSDKRDDLTPKIGNDEGASTVFTINISSASNSNQQDVDAKDGISTSSFTSPASKVADYNIMLTLETLSDRFKPLSDAFQEFARIALAGGDNANNNTSMDKQGAALDFSSMRLPAMKRSLQWSRLSSVVATTLLVNTYFATGRFSFFWEDTLYSAAGVGFPLTVAMHRSLCVLLGHMTWVAIGSLILAVIPRPFFFGRDNKWYRQNAPVVSAEEGVVDTASTNSKKKTRSNWVWWVIGGYSISAWLFNFSDFVNLYMLPAQVLEDAIAQEGVVTQLIKPENNDFLASVVGYIAPCISAPWWEEILYRGFFFPALTLFFPVWAGVFISGVVFSAHHLSLVASLPLAVLGWTWAGLYMASDNLWTTIVVHALWNSRVFLSSWLGL